MSDISARFFPESSVVTPRTGKVLVGISLKAGLLPRGETLQEVFEWTYKRFGLFSILLGDHLNRYNYAAFDHLSEAAAESRAITEGDSAVVLLQRHLERLSMSYTPIYRASELALVPPYPEHRERLVKHFVADERFRGFIQQGVDVFLTRTAVPHESRANVEPHCIEYQMEELAIFEMLVAMGYRTLVYPGAQLPVMKAFVCGQLKGISPALETMTLTELRVHRKFK